ncbi:MAG TPA: PQQ-binding-like beta-propeller repeat protein [Gemmataceae bacterium]|nr:PQQ-binding-like beta-propeller repeat protein [Gemmataceae bacterium]
MRPAAMLACSLLLGLFIDAAPCQPGGPSPVRVDRFGDPLPAGVLARMGSVRLDCEDSIESAAFAPDGKSLSVLTGAREKQLWLFDVATGRTIRRVTLPEGPRDHALTPDGRFLAVRTFYQRQADPNKAGARNFAEIHVLDAATGKPVWKTDSKQEFGSMALSADGKLLAGGTEAFGEGGDVFVWDLATGKQLLVLKGHLTPVSQLAFSTDGKRLLSASHDSHPSYPPVIKGSVRVWALPDGRLIKQTASAGSQYAFSPNGQSMAFRDADAKKVHLWSLERDREIAILPLERSEYRFLPDGRTFVTGSDIDMLRLWDAGTGQAIRSFQGLVGNGTRPLAVSPDGKFLASYDRYWSRDCRIRLWNVVKGTEWRPFGGHHLDIACLAFSPDGKRLLSAGTDQTARIWETASGKELVRHEQHQAEVTAVAFSADGRTVASGDRANVTHIWEASTGKLLHHLRSELEAPKGTHPAIRILSFSADGKTLWVGSRVLSVSGRSVTGEKGEIALYETATGKRIRSIRTEDSSPMAVSPDGALSVWTVKATAGRAQAMAVVRRLDTGSELFQIGSANDLFRTGEVVNQVVFSPDSRLIAINSHWRAESLHRSAVVPCYRLVEVASGRHMVDKSSTDFPWTIFTPDGRPLAGSHSINLPLAPVGGMVREARPAISVVDAVTEQVVGELPAHPLTTNPWAIAPSGTFFASANRNHTILVWDLTKQALKPPSQRTDASRAELETLWADLASADAKNAFRAAADLVAVPAQSVPFLCERLKPVAGVPPQSIVNHIKDLNNVQFEAREKARRALEKMGDLAEPALRQTLEEKPSLEARRRVEQLLEKLDRATRSPERVRAVRAVAILERAGTTAAREHLAQLAAGAPGGCLTEEARSALERLARRTPGTSK